MSTRASTGITHIIVLSTLLIMSPPLMGQKDSGEEGEDKVINKHRLTILMANAFIPAADNIADQNNIFIVPAWGINYDYWLSPKIGFGVHNTFILQQYKIERSSEGAIVERSFPVILSGEFLIKPLKNLTVSVGAGRELERHESFTVINTSIEYGFELQRGWEISLNLLYDHKIDAYDSWMFGAGFSKFFSCTRRKE